MEQVNMNNETIIEWAKGNQQNMPITVAKICDVLFGVWPDKSTKLGYDIRVVKGEALLQAILAINKPFLGNVSAVMFDTVKHALAFERLLLTMHESRSEQ
jgi:hypothetical protein